MMQKEYYESEADCPGYIYFKYSVNNRTPAHFHDSVELIFVEEGEFTAIGGGKEETLGQGDVFFADAYTPHLYRTKNGSRSFVLVLAARYLRDFRELYKGTLPMFMKAGNDKNAELFDFLRRAYGRWQDYSPLMRAGFADFVLGYLAARYPPKERADSRERRFIADALSYINDHFAEPLTAEGVARQLGYSPNYFSAQFNRCVRENFRDYLGGVRLQKTQELLHREPGTGVGAAARLCGFDSPNTYYRAKKRAEERTREDEKP